MPEGEARGLIGNRNGKQGFTPVVKQMTLHYESMQSFYKKKKKIN